MEERSKFHCVVSQQFWLQVTVCCRVTWYLSWALSFLSKHSCHQGLCNCSTRGFPILRGLPVYIWKLLFKSVFEFSFIGALQVFFSKSKTPEMCQYNYFYVYILYTCHDTGTNSTSCQDFNVSFIFTLQLLMGLCINFFYDEKNHAMIRSLP